MKRILKTLFVAITLINIGLYANAQDKLTGTVYKDGEPAAGVTVEVHKVSKVNLTGFDGSFAIVPHRKSKWIKFELPGGESEKVDIEEGKTEYNYYFGEKPKDNGDKTDDQAICLKSYQELKSDPTFTNNYTLYHDAYKQKKYKSAYPSWTLVYKKYPKCTKNIYVHGANILGNLIEKTNDPTKKNQYIDTLMQVYDNRIKYFNEEGYVLGRKGVDLLKYRKEDVEKAYEYLSKSVEMQGKEAEAAVIVTFMQATVGMYKQDLIDAGTVVANFSKSSDVLDKKLDETTDENDKNNIKVAMNGVEILFSESGAANCKALIDIFKPKFDANPNDVDLLKKITHYLDRAGCTDTTDLFADAAVNLYKNEPSAYGAYSIAKAYTKQEKYDKALEYFEEAIKQFTEEGEEENADQIARAYIGMAAAAIKMNQYAKTREYARKALKINPNMGKAYLLIGSAYAASSKSCGGNEFEQRAVYWAAVDKFQKAKAVDPTIEKEANQLIRQFTSLFPDNELAFFHGKTNGDSYTIGCWIQERTTVRTVKR